MLRTHFIVGELAKQHISSFVGHRVVLYIVSEKKDDVGINAQKDAVYGCVREPEESVR